MLSSLAPCVPPLMGRRMNSWDAATYWLCQSRTSMFCTGSRMQPYCGSQTSRSWPSSASCATADRDRELLGMLRVFPADGGWHLLVGESANAQRLYLCGTGSDRSSTVLRLTDHWLRPASTRLAVDMRCVAAIRRCWRA